MTQAFTRQSEAERRQAFVQATIACLAEHGYHGTSVRKIASAAGVTPGLLRHYYSGKEELIADAYRYGAELTRSHALTAAAAAASPRDRFRAFIEASLTGPAAGADLFRVWLAFWATTVTVPQVQLAHQETYQAYKTSLAELIAELKPGLGGHELAQLAIGANAIIDGLWLERGLDPQSFDAGAAAAIVYRYVGAVLTVSLD